MTRDNLYPLGLFLTLIITSLALVSLTYRFIRLNLVHLIQTCRLIMSDWIFIGHIIGLAVFTATLSFIAILIFKMVLILAHDRKLIKSLTKINNPSLPQLVNKLIKQHQIDTSQIVMVASDQPMALVHGLVKPKLIISTKLIKILSNKELESVVLHEIAHLKNHHPLKAFLSQISAAGLFFFPILALLTKNLRLLMEQTADQYTINLQGTDRHLKTALLKLINFKSFDNYLTGFDTVLEARIKSLINNYQISKPNLFFNSKALISSLTAVFLLVSVFILNQNPSHSKNLDHNYDCLRSDCVSFCQE